MGAWLAQPRQQTVRVTAAPAQPFTLEPGVRAAWFGETTLPRGAVAAIVAACVLLAGAAVHAWFVGGDAAVSIVLGVVACVLGAPRFRVPLAEVAGVTVLQVNPMGEFGGYGVRAIRGRTGIVLRRGPAIDVERTSGRHLVVTVADAAAGAALLQALAHVNP